MSVSIFPKRSDPKGIAGERRRVVGRGERIMPVLKVAALGVAIVAENLLYRKMRQSGWRLRP